PLVTIVSLPDALPISSARRALRPLQGPLRAAAAWGRQPKALLARAAARQPERAGPLVVDRYRLRRKHQRVGTIPHALGPPCTRGDRKSTRLNSSHVKI